MDEGFPNCKGSGQLWFCHNTGTRRHLQLCWTMMSPTTEGPACDCTYQSDPWCVCTDLESGADYESADSPHFLPSDLLEGLCWAAWRTAVGVGLSSERLAGDIFSVPRWRQPCLASLWGERTLLSFYYPVLFRQISPFHLSCITPLFVCVFEICNIIQYANMKSHRASFARLPLSL